MEETCCALTWRGGPQEACDALACCGAPGGTVSARDEVLRRIRGAAPPPAELPDVGGRRGRRFDDLAAQFARALPEVGGRCVRVSPAQLGAELRNLAESLGARRIGSLVPDLPGVDLDAATTPHAYADLDLAVIPGELGVAENGAVWITDRGMKHRALFVVAQHLAVVVSESALVNDMHEAYERVSIPRPGFGCFVSGPSKTADIEQALVIGAHGARSCTVFLVAGANG
jgi:L-lactate dehydrogenase complex protein LldG